MSRPIRSSKQSCTERGSLFESQRKSISVEFRHGYGRKNIHCGAKDLREVNCDGIEIRAPRAKKAKSKNLKYSRSGLNMAPCSQKQVCRRLYGVIAKGRWSGNAIMIASGTFLIPKHILHYIKTDVSDTMHLEDNDFKRQKFLWAESFKNDILLIEGHCFCEPENSDIPCGKIFKIISATSSSIKELDAMIIYGTVCEPNFHKLKIQLKKDVIDKLLQNFTIGPHEQARECLSQVFPLSTSKSINLGDVVVTAWIMPINELGTFEDPSLISDITSLCMSDDRIAYTISYVINYVGYPLSIFQTSTNKPTDQYSVENLQHFFHEIALFGPHARYIESTSAGSSGGIVFHVAIEEKHSTLSPDSVQILPIGVHIGRNEVQYPSYQIAENFLNNSNFTDQSKTLGEFLLLDQAITSTLHPTEIFL